MNCYNLPSSRIRYEQTGIFNAYTYLYTDKEEDQTITITNEEKIDNVTINCAEAKNKKNPNCLKGTYNNLDEILKIKMPETLKKKKLKNLIDYLLRLKLIY